MMLSLVEQPNTDTVEPVVNPSTDIATDSDNVEPQSPVANVAPSSDSVVQSVVDMQADVTNVESLLMLLCTALITMTLCYWPCIN